MLFVRFYDFVPEIYVLKCFNVNVQIMDRKRNEICGNGKYFSLKFLVPIKIYIHNSIFHFFVGKIPKSLKNIPDFILECL